MFGIEKFIRFLGFGSENIAPPKTDITFAAIEPVLRQLSDIIYNSDLSEQIMVGVAWRSYLERDQLCKTFKVARLSTVAKLCEPELLQKIVSVTFNGAERFPIFIELEPGACAESIEKLFENPNVEKLTTAFNILLSREFKSLPGFVSYGIEELSTQGRFDKRFIVWLELDSLKSAHAIPLPDKLILPLQVRVRNGQEILKLNPCELEARRGNASCAS